MKENEETKIQYQFTASPLNLMYVLDSDCLKMLNLLIQEDSYWRSQGQLKDGYFFKSINDLKDDMFMANDQDVRLTIDALYINGIIDVINQGDRHKASKFKINVDKIREIDSKTILEVKKFYPIIRKLKRGSPCSYMEKASCPNTEKTEVDDITSDSDQTPGSATNCSTDCHTNCTTDCNPDCSPTCTPKLDKSDLLNKSYSINKIDDNIINNNIINNEVIEEESFHPLNTSIGQDEQITTNLNGEQIVNASAPQADAHGLDSMEKKYTKEELLIRDFLQASKDIEVDDIFEILRNYAIDDLKYLNEVLPSMNYRNSNVTGYIKYLIEMAKRNRRAA